MSIYFASVQGSSRRLPAGRFAFLLLLPLLLLVTAGRGAYGQNALIQGQVNSYRKVLEIHDCKLIVDYAKDLKPGQKILIIQMDGGYWELNAVGIDPTETTLPLEKVLVNPRNFSIGRTTQVVVLPENITTNATVTGTLQAQPWNREMGTGGVIYIDIPGTLTLNADIDASGVGFGYDVWGNSVRGSAAFCSSDLSTSEVPTPEAALKGDAIDSRGRRYGRFPWMNGGGGGVAYNSGGGGGANYGSGGHGGREALLNAGCPPADNGGGGGAGWSLVYENQLPWPNLHMGGSGGQGHQNNGQGSDGARGGGIIFIVAERILVNGSRRILANGLDAPPSGNDGAGGGGGGGAIALFSPSLPAGLRVEARGGRGGNMTGNTERAGPGGGGGGGVILSMTPLGAGATDVSGGVSGVQTSFSSNPHGATAGAPGGLIPRLSAPLRGNATSSPLRIDSSGSLTFCQGGSVTLTAGIDDVRWTKEEDPDFSQLRKSIVVTESGTYTAQGKVDDCPVLSTVKVTVWERPRFAIGAAAFSCGVESFIAGSEAGASGGTPPYTYLWETDDPGSIAPGDEWLPMLRIRPTRTGRYKVTVTDAKGCQYVEEFTYRHTAPIVYNAPDLETCAGTPTQIGVEATGGTPPFAYQWDRAADLNDATLSRPTVLNPAASGRYAVKVTDFNGCIKFDTLVLTVRPQPVTGVSPNATVCAGSSTQLAATGGVRYSWSPGDVLSCTDCATPTAQPARTTTYTVTITDANGCSRSETVTVNVRSPMLSSAADSLDFGTLEGCRTNAEQSFFLRNGDSLDNIITAQSFTGAGFSVVSPGLPATIRGLDSVRVVVRFTPATTGLSLAKLMLRGDCDISFGINLSGTLARSAVSADVGVINFGQSLVCSAVPHDTVFNVTNTGEAPLTFDAPVIAAPFELLSPAMPLTIPPGESREFRVRYNPGTTAGTFSQDLKLPYIAGDCRDTLPVRLNGTNIRPLAASSRLSIAFPELVGCNLSSDDSVVITNTGEVPIDLRLLDISPGFRLLSSVPATLQPGESRAMVVRFEPVAQGAANGLLRLLYGACNDTIPVTLSGSAQGVSFATSDSIDFGELAVCAGESATMTFRITNTSAGNADGRVGDVLVTGPFSTTLQPGETLANGVEEEFQVTFTPAAEGDATGTIELTLEPCGVRRTIHLRGRRTNALLRVNGAAIVNFGPVPATTTQTKTIRFRNDGTATLRGVTLAGIAAPFTVISTTPALPATLAPGEELVAVVEYTGTSGRQTSVLQAISDDPCVVGADVQLIGDGESAATGVRLEDFAAAPGQQIIVPLLVSGTEDLSSMNVTSFTATIRYRRSLLILSRQGAPALISDNLAVDPADGRYMLYTFTAPFVSGDTLATLKFIAALGDTQAAPVTIESFAWSNPSISADRSNAIFTLQGICITGESRLINAEGNLTLKPVRPNPVITTMEIEYELVEDGPTELFISNMQGERVAMLVDDVKKPGRYVLTVDASDLPSGSYIYVLQTSTQRLMQRMQIVK